MLKMSHVMAALMTTWALTPAWAQDIPPCALTGSVTMMIGGKPALRLSDVANCPADSYEIVNSIQIDGQPMVHLKPVITGKVRCITLENPTVLAEGKQATTLGDTACGAVK